MAEYIVRVGSEIRCQTTWQPAAVAAWVRATCDWNAARRGESVELLIDGQQVAEVKSKTGRASPWPVEEDDEPDIRDVAAGVLQLCRAAGVSAADLADAM